MPVATPKPTAPKVKLLDQIRIALRATTAGVRKQTYVHWIRQFILFHGKRHPAEMAEPEINSFLADLAVKRRVSASTQNQALSAFPRTAGN